MGCERCCILDTWVRPLLSGGVTVSVSCDPGGEGGEGVCVCLKVKEMGSFSASSK